MKNISKLWVLCFCLINSWAVAARPSNRPVVVLLSIDGLSPQHVLKAETFGADMPHLKSFVEQGAHATGVKGILPTLTYPAHATLLTGVNPSRHGILNNRYFDPKGENKGAWYWYAYDFKVPTLWDLATQAGWTTGSISFPVSIGANVKFNVPQIWGASSEIDYKNTRALSTPGLLEELEKRNGKYAPENWTAVGDEQRLNLAMDLLRKKSVDFLTVYFSSLDESQHHHGLQSDDLKSTLQKLDSYVGKLKAALTEVGGENSVMFVVSDHGFLATHTELRLNVALLKAGLIKLDPKEAKIKDWDAFAWDAEGVAVIQLKNPKDEKIKSTVKKILAKFQKGKEAGIDQIFENSKTLELGGFPDATFLVTAKPGFRFVGKWDGNKEKDKSGLVATHGYLPENPHMNAAFFAVGKGINKGMNVGEISMTDIAPTIAKSMGLEIPEVAGKKILN